MIEALYRLLKNLGYDHPIHAPLTHMPIGLIAGALVFFLVALIFKRKQLILSARHASILALVFAVPTILFGVFDWIHFYHGVLFPAIKYKMFLAVAVVILLGLGIILGSEIKLRSLAMTLIYAFCFIAAVGLGYFGGNIVFGQGLASAADASSRIGVSAAPSSPAPAGNEGEGRSLFASNCQACHAGGGNSISASLPIKGSKRLANLESFTSFIRAPSMPDGKPGDMPPFGKDTLDDGQVSKLYSFLSTEYK
ncbi:MAG: c-type cytochrome [Rectinemataceae bacterium]|jgi:mono/diheme cytochrome c family protein